MGEVEAPCSRCGRLENPVYAEVAALSEHVDVLVCESCLTADKHRGGKEQETWITKVRCSRCSRSPHDPEPPDFDPHNWDWMDIDGEFVCPGCQTSDERWADTKIVIEKLRHQPPAAWWRKR